MSNIKLVRALSIRDLKQVGFRVGRRNLDGIPAYRVHDLKGEKLRSDLSPAEDPGPKEMASESHPSPFYSPFLPVPYPSQHLAGSATLHQGSS